MTALGEAPAGYRPCAGLLIVNRHGEIFVGERLDTPGAWQMPQGGIDPGEAVEAAVERELLEETGMRSIRLLRISDRWRCYDLPENLSRNAWKGRFRGQAQVWAMLLFDGADDEIDLDHHHREFARWKWTDRDGLLSEIVDFKRDVYRQVLEEFGDILDRIARDGTLPRDG